ncbi:MAG: DUF2752 domain-containing protein [Stomatobaculum sp.]|nr:DUF2752 domain-containing protein [Stomatobaculum sp.]
MLKAAAIIAVFYGFLQLLGITCPIKFITGISCPGCGMTRAWISVLVFHDLHKAFHYHPLFWIVIPALPFFLSGRLSRSRLKGPAVALASAAMIAVYLYRMFYGSGDIVVFAPWNGAVWKVLQHLIRLAAGFVRN